MNAVNNQAEYKPLTLWQKFTYGLGDLASQFVWTFVGSYLTVFYTDVVGFVPAVVSIIMLVARIWDAINDPMMGAIAERTRTRFGRFRPYIAFGCPFLALFGILTFVAPFGNGTAGVIWAAVIYIAAGMLYTLTNIPYASLVSVMTTDANERNQLNAFRSAGMFAGQIIVSFCSSSIILAFSGGASTGTAHGYMMTAVIYSLASIPLFLLVFFNSREVVQPKGDMRKVPITETFKNLVKNKYLMIISAIMLCEMTGYMGRIAITSYYVIYCIGSYALIGTIMVIPCILGVISSMISTPVIKVIGKRNTLLLGMIIQAVGLILIYFTPFTNMPIIYLGHVIFGAGGIATPVMLSMVADSVDYMDLKTGIRTDGTAYATYGLASKAGNAIGSAVGVLLLGAFGYVANAEQTTQALHGINLTVNLLPAIVLLVGAALCLLWNLSDKDAAEIREKLAIRNAESTEEEVTTAAETEDASE